jgi:hypothetical protein
LTEEGQETLVRESSLIYQGAPAADLIKKAAVRPISIKTDDPYQLRTVRLDENGFIVIARSRRNSARRRFSWTSAIFFLFY